MKIPFKTIYVRESKDHPNDIEVLFFNSIEGVSLIFNSSYFKSEIVDVIADDFDGVNRSEISNLNNEELLFIIGIKETKSLLSDTLIYLSNDTILKIHFIQYNEEPRQVLSIYKKEDTNPIINSRKKYDLVLEEYKISNSVGLDL